MRPQDDDTVSLREYLERRMDMQDVASQALAATQAEAIRIALDAQRTALVAALDAQKEAVRVALEVVDRTSRMHSANHDKAHEAHAQEHRLEKESVAKTEKSMDVRLYGMNEFRDQLREQASHFITRNEIDAQATAAWERSDGLVKALNFRIEEGEKSRYATAEAITKIQTRSATYLTVIVIAIPIFSIIMNIVFSYVGTGKP